MKALIVGGAAQGKRDCAAAAFALRPQDIVDGGQIPAGGMGDARALDRLHLWTRRLLQEGQSPLEVVAGALSSREHWVVICDEIGCGVVPVDAFDRQWREETGRLCCHLAREADLVQRIHCGIAVTLKGGPV